MHICTRFNFSLRGLVSLISSPIESYYFYIGTSDRGVPSGFQYVTVFVKKVGRAGKWGGLGVLPEENLKFAN